MALKPLLQQLVIWTSISIASGYALNLTDEVSAFIPKCAQGCFTAFIQDNKLSTACGTTPSLQCLCSHESTAGITIGEAAAECIGGSFAFGICTADDGNKAATAYSMCSGQTSALPNLQPIPLSAAFIVGGGSVRIIPTTTVATSAHISTSGSASEATSVTSVTTTATSGSATTSSSAPVTRTSSTATIPPETASPQTSESATPEPAVSLGTAQIVGISVGIFSAIALALGAIFLARRARQRRYPGLDDEGFMPMDEKSSLGGGGAVSRFTRIFHISPPLLRTQRSPEPFIPPQDGEFQNVDRNTIGLAISRPRSEIVPKQQTPRRDSRLSKFLSPKQREPTQERRASKLLPMKPLQTTKPNLTLNIPNAVHPALRPQSTQPLTDRTSAMTNMTAFADLDTEAPEGGQIWRPPPSDPQSATTYYVADKWGNWVLSSNSRQSQLAGLTEVAELDTYTPLTKSPIERQEEAAAAAMAGAISAASAPETSRPQQALLQAESRDAEASRASSVYSQVTAPRITVRPPLPINKRSSSSGRRRRPSRADSKTSMDSATTIQTSSSGGGPFDESPPVEEEDPRPLSSLSPVVESPHTPTGRSPVRYPRIPGRLDLNTIRMVPPPRRPDFTASPPGQPSPTLGASFPLKGSPSPYPQPLNPKRVQRPEVRNGVEVAPTQQMSGSGFSPEPSAIPKFPVFPKPPPRSELRLSRQYPPRLETQDLPPPRTAVSSYISPTSAVTTSSAASSLLAKRVGNEKAAALSLENSQKKVGGSWRRQGPGGLLSPDMAGMASPSQRAFGVGGLPATPTWQPKLTPTRRGDDLFLNVQ